MYIAVVVAVVVVAVFIFLGFFGVNGTQQTGETPQNAAQTLLDDIARTGGVSSLQIVDTIEGAGVTAKPGDTVTVNYTGVLPDGTVFDASAAHGQPFTFTIGETAVIQGWHQGLVGMKVGGTRILAIPPELGYGARENGKIPANSSLIFQIELLSIGAPAQ